MQQHTLPADIERTSMSIIRAELAQRGIPVPEEVAPVVWRVIHTTADFDYAENLRFTPGAVARGIEALQNGASIITDTRMAIAWSEFACLVIVSSFNIDAALPQKEQTMSEICLPVPQTVLSFAAYRPGRTNKLLSATCSVTLFRRQIYGISHSGAEPAFFPLCDHEGYYIISFLIRAFFGLNNC